jgi:hypothetical protein
MMALVLITWDETADQHAMFPGRNRVMVRKRTSAEPAPIPTTWLGPSCRPLVRAAAAMISVR